MLPKPILANNLEGITSDDLRYFLYLSKNDAWIMVANDIFRFNITHLIEVKQRLEEEIVYYDHQLQPLTQANEAYLKTLLSKTAYRANVYGVAVQKGLIAASDHPSPHLALAVHYIKFSDLKISLNGKDSLKIQAEAFNFDAYFLARFKEINNKNEQEQFLQNYHRQRQTIRKKAVKNAIWLAAASGDNQQLDCLLTEFPHFKVNLLYKKKNLLEAMFNADPQTELPFKNTHADYKETLQLLLAKGFDSQTMIKLVHQHETNRNSRFFPQKNPHQLLLLRILKELLGLPAIVAHENQSLLTSCTLM